ncbi:heme exporter protein CcmD [Rhodovulum adriaticum]|uniref:Heme exporter protein D n=1 Tax=Rhodovulum adriaticum TaxID=35804 RepID=A0A4R2NUB7_RHOAD|nr:heme exporter protein CcmD [Rhodovulum adriaticum]MBK1636192.1 heme exporter protein CcmD [Rhodovulum adriaticum]TCP25512.1 heme exporter protein D [Rhodovulum adriaticum]
MIPDLGKYAGAVLSSYAISLGLLILLVAFSVWRAARVRRQLEEVEARRKSDV